MGMAMMLLLIPAVSTTAQVNAIPQTSSQDTQKRRITGQILDDQGEPLIGATVSVKGGTEKVLTDLEGNFTLQTAVSRPVIVISYV